MSFFSNILYMGLGSLLTLLSGLIFLTYRQRQIQKEFEKLNSLDEIRDQMEQFKKSFSENNFSKEIDSMMKNFEEDSDKKEKAVEIKGKKDSSKEEK